MGLCCLPLSQERNQMGNFLQRHRHQSVQRKTLKCAVFSCSSQTSPFSVSPDIYLHQLGNIFPRQDSLSFSLISFSYIMYKAYQQSRCGFTCPLAFTCVPLQLKRLRVRPLDCFLWVLQHHQTGYKSHCIITAPCFASRCARPPHGFDWPVQVLGRPLWAGHRRNRKSRLLLRDRWLEEGVFC